MITDPKNNLHPVRFGVVIFPGFQALDVFGPLDILNTLSWSYKLNLSVIAATLDPVSTQVDTAAHKLALSRFAQSIVPTHTFASVPPLDVLIVPGGFGVLPTPAIQPVIGFVARVYPDLQYLIGVCTGVAIVAQAGILDGRKATTNKAGWAKTAALRPQVDWVPQARWVRDGNIWTTSGVSAGIDGTFSFVNDVFGPEEAERLATTLEYERHLDSTWDPFAKVHGLQLRTTKHDNFDISKTGVFREILSSDS